MLLLDSLKQAYSEPGLEIAPDPTRLAGLISLVHLELDGSAGHHVSVWAQRMRGEVVSARVERENEFVRGKSRLAPEVLDLLRESFAAYHQLEDALTCVVDAFEATGRVRRESSLRSLEAAAEELRRTSDELVELHACGEPVCLRCHLPNDGPVCPCCGHDCLWPDPEGSGHADFQQTVLPPAHHGVFVAYSRLLSGGATVAQLVESLRALDQTLREFEAIAVEMREVAPDSTSAGWLWKLVKESQDGAQQIRRVGETRALRDLHQGWARVFDCTLQIQRLLPRLS